MTAIEATERAKKEPASKAASLDRAALGKRDEPAPFSHEAEALPTDYPGASERLSAWSKLDESARAQAAQRWQQYQGNAYLQRLVAQASSNARQGASPDVGRTLHPTVHNTVQHTASVVQRTPAAPTQAAQEAEAQATQNLLTTVSNQMLSHSNATLRNTGRLFTSVGGQPARLGFTPMTLRSDNANLILTRHDPADTAYYFFGLRQNNEHKFGPHTMGTIDGDNVVIRGKSSSGSWRTTDELMGTLAHEASHILVKSYGEHPATATDAGSFDRYKDEFRAYWIEPVGHYSTLSGSAKATAIRTHLVGTALHTGGYADLNTHYWTDATFKTQVDNHTAPDGYNLANNPNLDRLYQLLNGIRGGSTTLEATLTHIVRMSPAERSEATASPLIQRLYRSLGADDSTRVEYALKFPVVAAHATLLNPSNSMRVTSFLEAIALRESPVIKERYQQLTVAEKANAMTNAAMMVFIDRQIVDTHQRASIYAMIVGGSISQFDAMGAFLDACLETEVEGMLNPDMTEVPARLSNALRLVGYRARLALYRLVEDARRQYVDVLLPPIRRRVLNALIEGGAP